MSFSRSSGFLVFPFSRIINIIKAQQSCVSATALCAKKHVPSSFLSSCLIDFLSIFHRFLTPKCIQNATKNHQKCHQKYDVIFTSICIIILSFVFQNAVISKKKKDNDTLPGGTGLNITVVSSISPFFYRFFRAFLWYTPPHLYLIREGVM